MIILYGRLILQYDLLCFHYKISQGLETARLGDEISGSLWNFIREQCSPDSCQISDDNFKHTSRSLKTSRDLTIRRLFWYWNYLGKSGLAKGENFLKTTYSNQDVCFPLCCIITNPHQLACKRCAFAYFVHFPAHDGFLTTPKISYHYNKNATLAIQFDKIWKE